MRFYPVSLNIEGKKCVVIGGGKVAERKVENILFCGGKVKVISPDLSSGLLEMAKQGKIDYIKCEYKPVFLEGAYLVYAATSNREVNSGISGDAGKLSIMVNVCDSRDESTFILPAVVRKKEMTIAVSTDGISPEKAVETRDKLKEIV